MSKVIWKFPLNSHEVTNGEVTAPKGAVPIHFANQDGRCTLWCEVEENAPLVSLRIAVVGTGHEVPEGGVYVGTAFEGYYVWHFYWFPSENDEV